MMTDALRAELAVTESGGPEYHKAMRRMGADGWLGLGWPKEYGGQERSPVEQFIFFDEVQRAGFPIPFLTLNTVGPTLMKYGTDAQKSAFLPRILRGELHFAIGYTEPSAGTDLASLKTTRGARRRPLHHQRPEGLHEPGDGGRLHLAGRAHRAQRAQAQGHLNLVYRREDAGRIDVADSHHGRQPARARPTTRTCGCR
jgi:hypothetical protein